MKIIVWYGFLIFFNKDVFKFKPKVNYVELATDAIFRITFS